MLKGVKSLIWFKRYTVYVLFPGVVKNNEKMIMWLRNHLQDDNRHQSCTSTGV